MGREQFIEDVKNVCARPGLYTIGGTYNEVAALFTGYAMGSQDCPLSGEGWHRFREYICALYRFPAKYAWLDVIRTCAEGDEDAINRMCQHLTEFAERLGTESAEDIVHDAREKASHQEEGEVERAWRAFSHAMFFGRREEIEPLILPHPDADTLWKDGGYPEGVGEQLAEIADRFAVSRIPGGTETEVKVITPDFGPVLVRYFEGRWRVDASKIISAWARKK